MHIFNLPKLTRPERIYCFAVVIALFTTGWSADAATEKLLRWQFQPGEAMDVSFSQDMTVQMTAMGQDVESSADMSMTMRWIVQSVEENGAAQIHQSIDRMSMRLETPGTDLIEYDSAQAEKPIGPAAMLATSVDPMIGIDFAQRMSAAGEILDVTLSEKSKQQLAAAPSGAQLKEVLSRDGLKALLSQATAVFPETPVKPGDTWNATTASQSPVGQLSMEMKYTYVGTETHKGRPLERIDVDMKLEFPPQANNLNVVVRNQDNHGTLYFDAAAGRFVNSELTQNMRLVTTVGDQQHAQLMTTVLRMNFTPVSQVAQASATLPAGTSRVEQAGGIQR